MRIALAISGSDPSGGGGLQADLQVFQHFGVRGAGAVTALTVQDTARVHQVLPVFPQILLDQIRVVLRDVTPDAVKVGMLATDDGVRMAALGLEALAVAVPIVVDPVLAASDGKPLLERRALGSLQSFLARAALVTPNLREAEILTGCETGSRAGAEAAARVLLEELGAGAALVKGGHRDDDSDDLLATRDGGGATRLAWLAGARLPGAPARGTGCALSSAIAARLALGDELEAAVAAARAFVRGALGRAEAVGGGARLLGFA